MNTLINFQKILFYFGQFNLVYYGFNVNNSSISDNSI